MDIVEELTNFEIHPVNYFLDILGRNMYVKLYTNRWQRLLQLVLLLRLLRHRGEKKLHHNLCEKIQNLSNIVFVNVQIVWYNSLYGFTLI